MGVPYRAMAASNRRGGHRARQEFKPEDKLRMLLWCQRHCCLCGKPCGTNVEVAHVDAGAPATIDNGIPLCFDCHARIGQYSREHPRGTKYKAEELKARREQIYEEHTRHLVPPINVEITQNLPNGQARIFPNVGINVTHLGDALPVRVLIDLEIFHEHTFVGKGPGGLVSGRTAWNLNPRFGIAGHFEMPREAATGTGTLEISVSTTVVDQYDRPHALLPISFVFMRDQNSWYLHPAPGKF
jgi:hypothetical protein